MIVGQIAKVNLPDGHIFGRVVSVDEFGDAQVRFNNNGTALLATVLPEMVADSFWQDGKGRYGV